MTQEGKMTKRTVGDLLDEIQDQTVIIRRTVKGAMSFDAKNCSTVDVIGLIEWARIMVRCAAIREQKQGVPFTEPQPLPSPPSAEKE